MEKSMEKAAIRTLFCRGSMGKNALVESGRNEYIPRNFVVIVPPAGSIPAVDN
jgi:hypothetical protein